MEKEEVFSPEQIMGMLLTKLKTISEAELSTKVTDCVVSVSNSKRCLLEKLRSLHIVHILCDVMSNNGKDSGKYLRCK